MNPDNSSLVLSQDDYNFIERVINDITEDNLLPFSLPPASIPRLIKKSAQFFYDEYDEALQEIWFTIKCSDIQRDPTLNAQIQLPVVIQEVGEVRVANNQVLTMTNPLRFMKEPLLYGGSIGPINAVSGFGSSGALGGLNSIADRREIYEEGLVSMWAYMQDKTLFTKGIRFAYNPNTHIINIQGQVQGDLIFNAFQRIPLAALYQNRLFFDHVRGTCMSRLTKILRTFQFQYPGDVSLDLSEIEREGSQLVEKVETEVKEISSGNDLFYVT